MNELIQSVAAWPTLLVAVLVFGVAPGFCLRLIVKIYPRGDPRRDELVAELYAMPRIERIMWVGDQFETALFEGLSARKHQRDHRRKRRNVYVKTRTYFYSRPDGTKYRVRGHVRRLR